MKDYEQQRNYGWQRTGKFKENYPSETVHHRLRVFGNRVLRTIFEPKMTELTGGLGNRVARSCIIYSPQQILQG